MKRRLIYISLTILCLVLCFLIVKLFDDNHFIRGFIGDIIIVIFMYFFIKSFHEYNNIKLAAFTLAIAYITEFSQYFKLITHLGLEHNRIAQVVLGTVFDPRDLLAYTIGAILVYIVDSKFINNY